MRSVQYKRYMQSAEWQARKGAIIKRDGYRCRQCGNPCSLEVHHLTYSRLGNEHPGDLVTLCKACHRKVHETACRRRKS